MSLSSIVNPWLRSRRARPLCLFAIAPLLLASPASAQLTIGSSSTTLNWGDSILFGTNINVAGLFSLGGTLNLVGQTPVNLITAIPSTGGTFSPGGVIAVVGNASPGNRVHMVLQDPGSILDISLTSGQTLGSTTGANQVIIGELSGSGHIFLGSNQLQTGGQNTNDTKRFYRGRTRSGSGTGLGLTIAELAAARIGACLSLANRSDRPGLLCRLIWA